MTTQCKVEPAPKSENSNRFLQEVYQKYQKECTYWLMQKFGISREDSIDVFQNTAIILFDKLVKQGLNIPEYKLRSYIYGIARNKGLEHLRSVDRFITKNFVQMMESSECAIKEKKIKELKIEAVNIGLDHLNPSSRTILDLYYKDQKSITEITAIMGYKNHETTKNMKYKSLKKLKTIVNKSWDSSLGLNQSF